VISTERLKRDLEEWETLYVAGRLHKPVSRKRTSTSVTLRYKLDLFNCRETTGQGRRYCWVALD
jgi:hypothetical protein